LGSCAFHLAQLAAGASVGCWEYNPKIWDIAAGLLLVREAGGVVRLMDGGDPVDQFVRTAGDPGQALPTIAAANEEILDRMQRRGTRPPSAG
jgi:fructose-1,6-bisphosphatase/inositol monophosphatase family enzyme